VGRDRTSLSFACSCWGGGLVVIVAPLSALLEHSGRILRFGSILAPLYSCVAVFFALHFDRKLKKEQNILVKLFYVYIVFWFSLFMAISPNVIDPNIWAPFIGIWLIKLEKTIFNPKTNLQ
jgi:hypothetical protein